MKKLIVLFSLFLASNAWAVETEKYAVLKPDGSVAIVQYIPNPQKSLAQVISELGFDGFQIRAITEKDITADRRDRNFWTLSNGKIVVDSVKKQADADAKTAEQAKKDAVLGKLKISAQELKDVLK